MTLFTFMTYVYVDESHNLDASTSFVALSYFNIIRLGVNVMPIMIREGVKVGHQWLFACLIVFVGCLTSQQHASVTQGRICSNNITCCHTEIEVADQTFYLTQSQYTDNGPISPSTDPIIPGAWQGSHWSASF